MDEDQLKLRIQQEMMTFISKNQQQINTIILNYNPYESKKIQENFRTMTMPERIPIPIEHMHSKINCVEVSEHAVCCNVCSRLYSNNNAVFIFIIIFQSVILILLIKRILEK